MISFQTRNAIEYTLDSGNPLIAINRFLENEHLLKNYNFLFLVDKQCGVGNNVPEYLQFESLNRLVQSEHFFVAHPWLTKDTNYFLVNSNTAHSSECPLCLFCEILFDTNVVSYFGGQYSNKGDLTPFFKQLDNLKFDTNGKGVNYNASPYIIENIIGQKSNNSSIWMTLKNYFNYDKYGIDNMWNLSKEEECESIMHTDQVMRNFCNYTEPHTFLNSKMNEYFLLLLLEQIRKNDYSIESFVRILNKELLTVPPSLTWIVIGLFEELKSNARTDNFVFFDPIINSKRDSNLKKLFNVINSHMSWDLAMLDICLEEMRAWLCKGGIYLPLILFATDDRGLGQLLNKVPVKCFVFGPSYYNVRLKDAENIKLQKIMDSLNLESSNCCDPYIEHCRDRLYIFDNVDNLIKEKKKYLELNWHTWR